MRHVMRALEDCVSGLFSYSDKISSHIPRSLTRLLTNTSQLSAVIVCLARKVTSFHRAEATQTLKIHVPFFFSVCSVHAPMLIWPVQRRHINLQNILILKRWSTRSYSVSPQQGKSTLSRRASSSYLAWQLYCWCFKAEISQTRLENLTTD